MTVLHTPFAGAFHIFMLNFLVSRLPFDGRIQTTPKSINFPFSFCYFHRVWSSSIIGRVLKFKFQTIGSLHQNNDEAGIFCRNSNNDCIRVNLYIYLINNLELSFSMKQDEVTWRNYEKQNYLRKLNWWYFDTEVELKQQENLSRGLKSRQCKHYR